MSDITEMAEVSRDCRAAIIAIKNDERLDVAERLALLVRIYNQNQKIWLAAIERVKKQ